MARAKNKKAVWIGLLMVLFLVFPFIGLAQNGDYELLAPLPNLEKVSQNNPLDTYIPYIFRLAIGLAAVAAVVMIVLGGVQYMTTDAVQGKEQGKARIKNAIIGLVLVISAWLILNTINPKLLDIDLTIEPAVVSGTGSSTPVVGTPMSQAQITESNSIRKSLESEDVWAYRGPCEQGQTKGCVNLNGLPAAAKDGLVNLNRVCDGAISGGCNIIITGGTEGGHASHGVNKPMVDLRLDANLTKYIETNKTSGPTQISYGIEYKVKIDGKEHTFVKESDHWHVIFQ